MRRTTYLILIVITLFFWTHQAMCQLCDRYWLPHEQLCYKYFEEEITYTEAETNCISEGAELTEKLPEELQDLLETNKQNETLDYWCRIDENKGLDGTAEPDNALALPGMEKRRRRNITPCCFVNNMTRKDGPCDEQRRYVCVKNSTSASDVCPQNNTICPGKADWDRARKYCQCSGSVLYSFKGNEDMDEFLKSLSANKEATWIGLRRENGSHVFRWSDGSSVTDQVLDRVKPQIEDEKFCIAYIPQSLTWQASDCNLHLPFICRTQDILCANATVENGGIRAQNDTNAVFRCKHGYRGLTCEERIFCSNETCQNEGICTQDGINDVFRCTCQHGYRGLTCEERISCSNKTCENEGLCTQDGTNGVFKCTCKHGYQGLACEERMLCSNETCKNEGICTQNGTYGVFKCTCKYGYQGLQCEENLSPVKVEDFNISRGRNDDYAVISAIVIGSVIAGCVLAAVFVYAIKRARGHGNLDIPAP